MVRVFFLSLPPPITISCCLSIRPFGNRSVSLSFNRRATHTHIIELYRDTSYNCAGRVTLDTFSKQSPNKNNFIIFL